MPNLYATNPLYRIGAVSKTTGIPVSTLRIWETRYGAFNPVKTSGQHRLFQEHDVSKALLLKQLSSEGHAISRIAPLDLAQLRHMGNTRTLQAPLQTASGDAVLRLAVVGLGLANRLESPPLAQNMKTSAIKVAQVWPDWDSACQAPHTEAASVLVVKVNSLQASLHASITSLAQKHGFARIVVLYHFAPEPVLKAMKFAGVWVRREPLSDTELLELLQSLAFAAMPYAAPLAHRPDPAPPERKYSDATLSRVAGISTDVLCECPRHVAELITQLNAFEQYSQECLSKSAQDAHLHTYLKNMAGSARALFETALEKVAQHENIDLQPDL